MATADDDETNDASETDNEHGDGQSHRKEDVMLRRVKIAAMS